MAYSYEGVPAHPERKFPEERLAGVIYILTNPSFPDYVKLGYATDMDERLRQLNSSECVPFAFHVYATYGVTAPLRDRDLHHLIDRLNPDLRSVERSHGRLRVREFYAMSAEDAYALLYGIARLSGTEHRLRLADRSEAERHDDEAADEIRHEAEFRRRKSRFAERGLHYGDEIALISDPDIKATVLDDEKVLCEGEDGELETGTLAAFTRLHMRMDRVAYAFRYWSYQGTPLWDLPLVNGLNT